MANSSGKVNPAEEFAGEFYHRASNTKYEIVPTKQGLEMRWRDERLILDFFIGSRRMGRSYAFLDNGYLYQDPVGYYATRRSWDMAPGYQADKQPYLDRPITRECLYCHASGARFAEGASNRILNWAALHGVSCERCHGEGGRHAAQPSRDNIVNPRRLSGRMRMLYASSVIFLVKCAYHYRVSRWRIFVQANRSRIIWKSLSQEPLLAGFE